MVFKIDGKNAEQITHALNLGKGVHLPKIIQLSSSTDRKTGKIELRVKTEMPIEILANTLKIFMFKYCKIRQPLVLKPLKEEK